MGVVKTRTIIDIVLEVVFNTVRVRPYDVPNIEDVVREFFNHTIFEYRARNSTFRNIPLLEFRSEILDTFLENEY